MKCDEIRAEFMDYLEGALTAEEEKEIALHLEECDECREELEEFKRVVKEMDESAENITVPEDFMKNIRERASKIELPSQKKKKRPLKVMLIAAAILCLSAVTVFAARDPIMQLIRLINPESRVTNVVDKGLGDRLNISKTDKDIKITVTAVAADDLQTLISYKIEDLKSGKEYYVNYKDGIDIKERWGEQIKDTNIKMCTSVFSSGGAGTLTLYPIDTAKKTINLAFTKLESKNGDAVEEVEGDWSFAIPINKHEGRSYDINKTVKAGNYTIQFNKITISPTLTKLSFKCINVGKQNKRIIGLEDVRIISKGKEYKPYNFGLGDWNPYSTIGEGDKEMTFDSMYFDDPKDIEIKLSRISTEFTEDTPKEFEIKLDESAPQEFEYLGTKLIINNLKVGEGITFDLKQPEFCSQYSMLSTVFWPAEEHSTKKSFTVGGSITEAYYVDGKNNKYDYNEALLKWDEIRGKKPVIYIANTSFKLHPSDGLDLKKEKYIRLIINGYTKTEFVDETVKVGL